MKAQRHDLGLPARRVAWAIWASMVATPLLLLAVVLELPPQQADRAPRDVLLLVAVATSALALLLSRLLPARIRPDGGRAHLTALARLVIAWSLCEGAAIFPLLASLLAPDRRLLAIFALDLALLLVSFPSRGRWEAALPPGALQLPRMVP